MGKHKKSGKAAAETLCGVFAVRLYGDTLAPHPPRCQAYFTKMKFFSMHLAKKH
jgi:hypothetical protein